MAECLICDSAFNPFVDFGQMPIANAFKKEVTTMPEYKFPMQVGFCGKCYMVQLVEQPEKERMFHSNYAFFSSTSKYMKNHFQAFASKLCDLYALDKTSFVVEIGCNDGIMLENFATKNIKCLGVEPSKNVAQKALDKGLEIKQDFFDDKVASEIIQKYSKANVIMSANVMCHIPYMHSIFKGIKTLLHTKGIFVFEDPYLGDIINKTSFDQIYDEHVFFFSALSVRSIAAYHNLELIDVEPQVTHGGSMRYYLTHKNTRKITQNVTQLISQEIALGLNSSKVYQNFSSDIHKIKIELLRLLSDIKKKGKKVVGYGATSKSTTVINYFGITSDLVESIFDTTPIKHNTYSPGANIPILPYKDFKESNPDYVLLFAWNHAAEIMEKERAYMKDKHWITYIPTVKII